MESSWKHIRDKKLRYALSLAVLLYFGAFAVALFGNIIFPTLLFGGLYVVPNQFPVPEIVSSASNPLLLPAIKLILVLAIVLPALAYFGKGTLISMCTTAFAGLLFYRNFCVATGLEHGPETSLLLSPLAFLDGLLVFIPAATLAILYTELHQNAPADLKFGQLAKVKEVFAYPMALLLVLTAAVSALQIFAKVFC